MKPRGLFRLVALTEIRRGPDEVLQPGQRFLADYAEAEMLCKWGRAAPTEQSLAMLGASPWTQPATR